MSAFGRAEIAVQQHIASGTAPCAVAEIGTATGASWRLATGRLAFDTRSPAATPDTVFDLASLTKVLATTTLALELVASGRLDLDSPVSRWIRAWRGDGRETVRIADLLLHASGLPAYRPYYLAHTGREAFERAIVDEPLEYAPRTMAVYSDVGFILLGFVLEEVVGGPLDRAFDAMASRAGVAGEISFDARQEWLPRLAPTSDDPQRVGTVDDRNAEALGGVAGHAGLFGTVAGVGILARSWLAARLALSAGPALGSPQAVARFSSRGDVPGSSRALGWDTMLPTSSCGTRMSPMAFGHTGFTGTSLWIDPTAGAYAVLLTNRVYPTPRPADAMTAFRRAFHDAMMEDLEELSKPG
jgi:CubicO group peptidase (beta-lactamase class C family)